jgi:hypothetical protein
VGSTKLLMASVRVLRTHKRLILFPVMATLAEVILLASFVVPLVVSRHGSSTGDGNFSVVQYVLFALGYLVLTAIGLFFNAALILAADQALRGEQPKVGTSLRAALRRLPTILAWAALSATISILVRAVDRKIPFVSGIIGIGWSLVTFLALPAIVLEDVGVVRSVRRSVELFRTTWGDEVSGIVRLWVVVLVLAIPTFPVLFFGFGLQTVSSMLIATAATVLWLGLVGLFLSTVTGVFRVAIYHFAATRTTPSQFAGIDLSQAFESNAW